LFDGRIETRLNRNTLLDDLLQEGSEGRFRILRRNGKDTIALNVATKYLVRTVIGKSEKISYANGGVKMHQNRRDKNA
jgi:hypothetical protein